MVRMVRAVRTVRTVRTLTCASPFQPEQQDRLECRLECIPLETLGFRLILDDSNRSNRARRGAVLRETAADPTAPGCSLCDISATAKRARARAHARDGNNADLSHRPW